jgi:chemotaxis protein MotA
MVSTPLPTLIGGLKRLKGVFLNAEVEIDGMIEEVIGFATKARKNGLVSLEQEAFAIEDPFLKKALTLAVDGTDLQEIRKMLELEIGLEEHHAEAEAKVFECAGGYAPTVGIIGAVMGLIQVMKNLANIDEVGHGIAVAFVATVYGVGSANLFFLPAASKIKARIHAEIQRKELILDGVAGIVEGLNPKLIRSKLESYSHAKPVVKEKQQVEKPVKGSDAPVSAQA